MTNKDKMMTIEEMFCGGDVWHIRLVAPHYNTYQFYWDNDFTEYGYEYFKPIMDMKVKNNGLYERPADDWEIDEWEIIPSGDYEKDELAAQFVSWVAGYYPRTPKPEIEKYWTSRSEY